MTDPRIRPDVSKFLVHLTRNSGGNSAEDNLINILNSKVIEARNHHCLFSPKLNNMRLSERLKKSFNTVCFTETPLDQIKKLAAEDFPRKIRLKPYGLVFWREDMLDYGANPAVYLNGYGSSLRNYLLSEFDSHFNDISSIKTLKCKQEFYNEIISYYSLINVMSERHDFSWEREWRHNGNFKFKYHDLVAIVADDPDNFLEKCVKVLNKRKMSYLKRTPIISAHWSYEDVVEEMAIKIWQKNA